MKKILVFFIIFGIFIGVVIGVSNELNMTESEENNDELVFGNIIPKLRLPISGVDTYNPLLTTNEHVSDVLNLIYEPLFKYDEENQLEPCLAQEFFKRGDNSWVIRIKKDVTWHDGSFLKAADVVYTINYLLNEATVSQYKANVRSIASVNQLDQETVVLNLADDDIHIINKLYFPIVKENSCVSNSETAIVNASVLNGTGAYKYQNENDEKIVLQINEKWWKLSNYMLEEIELIKYDTYAEAVKGFKSTEIDLIMTDMHTWKEKFGFIGINAYSYESPIYEVIIPNCNDSALSESSVRKAILQGINRPNIISNIYEENATIKDIPIPSYSKFKTESAEYNGEKAKQILVNAGWEMVNGSWKKGNKTLSFNMIVAENNSEQILVAEKIKSDMQEIGIKITIKKLSWNALQDSLIKGNYDLALCTLNIKNEYQIINMIGSSYFYNYAKYTNQNVDQIINDIGESQGEIYDEKFQALIDMYINEMPYIGLYFKNNTILSNKSVKGDFKSIAGDPYKNIINFYK